MLKKLILKNFQIHKRLEVTFSPTITIIHGPNDAGKSSVVRALYWVFYNQPTGDWMCRINEREEIENAYVRVIFDDGSIIKRIKGEKVNKYVVDGEEYENFGFGVPDPVKEVLRIHKFKTNKTEFPLHVAMQDDLPFLIYESSTVKASVIDTLTGMSIVQKAISAFTAESKELTKEVRKMEEDIEIDENAVAVIPDLDKAQKLVNRCESIQTEMWVIGTEIEMLEDRNNSLKELDIFLHRFMSVDVDSLESMGKQLESVENRLGILIQTKAKLEKCFQDIAIDVVSFEEINELLTKIENVEKSMDRLEGIKVLIQEENKDIDHYGEELESINEKLRSFYKANPLCPLCEEPFK